MGSQEIIAELTELSRTEMRAVKLAIDTLLAAEPDPGDEDGDPEKLWRQLVLVANDSGVTLKPVHVARKVGDWKKYASTAEEAALWITGILKPVNEIEHLAALRLVARAIIRRCIKFRNEIGLDLTPRVIMQQVGNYVEAMESAWPAGEIEYKLIFNTMRGHE